MRPSIPAFQTRIPVSPFLPSQRFAMTFSPPATLKPSSALNVPPHGNTLSGSRRNVRTPTYEMPASSVHRRDAPDVTTIFVLLCRLCRIDTLLQYFSRLLYFIDEDIIAPVVTDTFANISTQFTRVLKRFKFLKFKRY